jgi:hypothetical protein
MVFGVTAGRQKTPKHIVLPYAVKSLTNNVELIQILIRCGHGVAYSQIEELNTALCLQKITMTPENTVPLPDNIKPYNNTSLAWDNIDRTEETLSGGGTSHRVNGIAIQASYFGPHLSPPNYNKVQTKKCGCGERQRVTSLQCRRTAWASREILCRSDLIRYRTQCLEEEYVETSSRREVENCKIDWIQHFCTERSCQQR